METYTLDQIAQAQQQIAFSKKSAGIPNLANEPISNTLKPGKYSDAANPIQAPWEVMPDGGFAFNTPGVINTPVIGTWTDVINTTVPNGYDGVIRNILNNYNGGGFINGSGTLKWRILRNGQAVRGYDNILVQLGNDASTGITKIRVNGGDGLQYQVFNVSLGGAASQIFCYFGGWFYPDKVIGG